MGAEINPRNDAAKKSRNRFELLGKRVNIETAGSTIAMTKVPNAKASNRPYNSFPAKLPLTLI